MGHEYVKETTLFYAMRIGFNPHSTTAETARIATSLSFHFPPFSTPYCPLLESLGGLGTEQE
jgi:hypothetical protein